MRRLAIGFQPVAKSMEGNTHGRILNLFAQKPETPFQKSAYSVLSTPGTQAFSTLEGSRGVKGMRLVGKDLYAVTDAGLSVVGPTGAARLVFRYPFADNTVPMATDGNSILMVDGGAVLRHDIGTDEGSVVDTSGRGRFLHVDWVNGYFILTGEESIHQTRAGRADLEGADDFATPEARPDKPLAAVAYFRMLAIFGERTVELWYPSTSEGFSFAPSSSVYIDHGCAAAATIVSHKGGLYWLGDDAIVYALMGGTTGATMISTPALSERLANTGDATAFAYTEEGQDFYVLTAGGATWAYSITTGAWHQRASPGMAEHVASHLQTDRNRHIVAHRFEPRLMEYGRHLPDDEGRMVERLVETPPINAGNERVRQAKFALDMNTGAPLSSGGEQEVGLAWSDDGGKRWTPERRTGAGELGDYGGRVVWHQMGQFRSRIFRLRFYGGAVSVAQAYTMVH